MILFIFGVFSAAIAEQNGKLENLNATKGSFTFKKLLQLKKYFMIFFPNIFRRNGNSL